MKPLSPRFLATARALPGPALIMEVTMKKLVLAALAVLTLAVAMPVTGALAVGWADPTKDCHCSDGN